MRKIFASFLVLVLFSGCAGNKKSSAGSAGNKKAAAGGKSSRTPAYALPGVPLKNNPPGAPAAEKITEVPAEPAAEAAPAAPSPGPAGDLDFHLEAAKKNSAGRKYRSAAAEYGAALGFLPTGDARAVYVLERQGAMMLRAGNAPKAQEHFLSAIGKAKELNTEGEDLANSYLGLGYCLEKEKKVSDAIGAYEKAREFSGSKTVKTRIDKTISDLKNPPK